VKKKPTKPKKQAKRCLVTFRPQKWVFGYAEEWGNPVDIDVTDRVLAMGKEEALEIEDDSFEGDDLVKGLHKHKGPYAVHCEETIRAFFGAE
jgi:hypothetical protein